MIAPLPILTPGNMIAPWPIHTSSSITTSLVTTPCSMIGLSVSEKSWLALVIKTLDAIRTWLPIVIDPPLTDISQRLPMPELFPILNSPFTADDVCISFMIHFSPTVNVPLPVRKTLSRTDTDCAKWIFLLFACTVIFLPTYRQALYWTKHARQYVRAREDPFEHLIEILSFLQTNDSPVPKHLFGISLVSSLGNSNLVYDFSEAIAVCVVSQFALVVWKYIDGILVVVSVRIAHRPVIEINPTVLKVHRPADLFFLFFLSGVNRASSDHNCGCLCACLPTGVHVSGRDSCKVPCRTRFHHCSHIYWTGDRRWSTGVFPAILPAASVWWTLLWHCRAFGPRHVFIISLITEKLVFLPVLIELCKQFLYQQVFIRSCSKDKMYFVYIKQSSLQYGFGRRKERALHPVFSEPALHNRNDRYSHRQKKAGHFSPKQWSSMFDAVDQLFHADHR